MPHSICLPLSRISQLRIWGAVWVYTAIKHGRFASIQGTDGAPPAGVAKFVSSMKLERQWRTIFQESQQRSAPRPKPSPAGGGGGVARSGGRTKGDRCELGMSGVGMASLVVIDVDAETPNLRQ